MIAKDRNGFLPRRFVKVKEVLSFGEMMER